MLRNVRIYGYYLIGVILVLLWVWIKPNKSADNYIKAGRSGSTITVGVYPDHNLSEVEVLIEGYEPLQYYLDGLFLGEDDEGVKKLLAELELMKSNFDMAVLNPATAWIGDAGHPPGLRDIKYKYPLVRNIQLRSKIKGELDRIRGWSDNTPPIVPWKE